MISGGLKALFEVANMPCTANAIEALKEKNVMFGPAKAVNAGGVGVSGLEMAQNASLDYWTSEEVDAKLNKMMVNIFENASKAAKEYGVDLQAGANIAGF